MLKTTYGYTTTKLHKHTKKADSQTFSKTKQQQLQKAPHISSTPGLETQHTAQENKPTPKKANKHPQKTPENRLAW